MTIPTRLQELRLYLAQPQHSPLTVTRIYQEIQDGLPLKHGQVVRVSSQVPPEMYWSHIHAGRLVKVLAVMQTTATVAPGIRIIFDGGEMFDADPSSPVLLMDRQWLEDPGWEPPLRDSQPVAPAAACLLCGAPCPQRRVPVRGQVNGEVIGQVCAHHRLDELNGAASSIKVRLSGWLSAAQWSGK